MAKLLSYSEMYIDYRRHAWIYISKNSQVFLYDFCASPIRQISEKRKKKRFKDTHLMKYSCLRKRNTDENILRR